MKQFRGSRLGLVLKIVFQDLRGQATTKTKKMRMGQLVELSERHSFQQGKDFHGNPKQILRFVFFPTQEPLPDFLQVKLIQKINISIHHYVLLKT